MPKEFLKMFEELLNYTETSIPAMEETGMAEEDEIAVANDRVARAKKMLESIEEREARIEAVEGSLMDLGVQPEVAHAIASVRAEIAAAHAIASVYSGVAEECRALFATFKAQLRHKDDVIAKLQAQVAETLEPQLKDKIQEDAQSGANQNGLHIANRAEKLVQWSTSDVPSELAAEIHTEVEESYKSAFEAVKAQLQHKDVTIAELQAQVAELRDDRSANGFSTRAWAKRWKAAAKKYAPRSKQTLQWGMYTLVGTPGVDERRIYGYSDEADAARHAKRLKLFYGRTKQDSGVRWYVGTWADLRDIICVVEGVANAEDRCEKCNGYRWFDSYHFVASGPQTYEGYYPCPACNPAGKLRNPAWFYRSR